VQIFVYVIAGISIIVGGIGIANTMYTSVVERTKQIGIMKAIGAQRKTIFTLFLLESGFLGFIGGVVGILLGAGIAYGLAFLGSAALGSDLIRVSLNWSIIFGALLFSFIVGTVAGLFPAMQASRLVPVEALRYVK
jgi:putative ABC transport system permease protein